MIARIHVRTLLMQEALRLLPVYGFTSTALSRSALALPSHTQPLSETAVSALWPNPQQALINAWLNDGLDAMKAVPSPTIEKLLHARLAHNEPVLAHLPEAFALLASRRGPVDPVPVLKHAIDVADEACHLSSEYGLQLAWYAQRASIGAVYTAAELHQLASPKTAHAFLDSLLATRSSVKASVQRVQGFTDYFFRSWAGIINSKGIL